MRLDLDGLAAASREALMAEWREVVGRPPPKHLSKPLMIQILSYAYQVDTVGGYTKRLDGRLKSAARRDVVRPAFKPGSRFVREYHGITHVVEVSDDGRFVWKDQSYKSLSIHAPLLAIMSLAFSSLGCAHERGKPVVRAAVYTRKSSDEGLDQEFNSLDAQYEACSA